MTFIASIGKPCVVFDQDADTFFPDYGRWHHGVVEDLSRETTRVYHFDYGYSCTVIMNRFRNLPSEYAQQPLSILAFKCYLVGTENFIERRCLDIISRFMKSYIFAVRLLNRVDGILHVRLFTLGGMDHLEKHYGKRDLPQSE
jgi:hypothetical protein